MDSSPRSNFPSRGYSFPYRSTLNLIEYNIPDSPFSILPNEIISEIFKFCIPNLADIDNVSTPHDISTPTKTCARDIHSMTPGFTFSDISLKPDNRQQAYKDMMTAPIALSAVSKRWRSVALSTPSIWATLAYHAPGRTRIPPGVPHDITHTWLKRSRNQPLTILFSTTKGRCTWTNHAELTTRDTKIIEALLEPSIRSRWRTVYFDIPKYCYEATTTPLEPLLFSQPIFQAVTTLSLSVPSPSSFYNTIKNATGLRELTINATWSYDHTLTNLFGEDEFELEDESAFPLYDPILLPSLISLTVNTQNGGTNQAAMLFDMITTPMLSSMEVPISGKIGVHMRKLVKRSKCALEVLHLRHVYSLDPERNIAFDMSRMVPLLKEGRAGILWRREVGCVVVDGKHGKGMVMVMPGYEDVRIGWDVAGVVQRTFEARDYF